MRVGVIIFLIATITATSVAVPEYDYINLPSSRPKPDENILPDDLDCLSWRLAVEADNIIDWDTVPIDCETYIGNYMLGEQYRSDSAFVINQALAYAQSLDNISADGTDLWIFDVDETTLSNLPYFAANGFGTERFNSTSFDEWVALGIAPALPESLKLYQNLLALGINVVFLTERDESLRNITTINLQQQGYTTWEKLILKNGTYENTIVYKVGERVTLLEAGYRIIGNIGDQWTDILGIPAGKRTFKLPDPVYYVP